MAEGDGNGANGNSSAVRRMGLWIRAGAVIMGLTLAVIASWGIFQAMRLPPQPSAFSLGNSEKLERILEMEREQIRLMRLVCASLSRNDARALSECYR